MAQLPEDSHDSTDVEPAGDFDPVPTGEYTVIIIDSEMRETKDKSNDYEYLNVTMQIIKGEYKGRCFFTMFNLRNSNDAMKIANRQLAGLKQAIGVLVCRDSVKLHNIPFIAKAKFVPEDDENGWPAKNEVKAYKKIEISDNEEEYEEKQRDKRLRQQEEEDHIVDDELDEYEDDKEMEVIEPPKKKKKKKKKAPKDEEIGEDETEAGDPPWDE